jgi:hypothetical protein
MLTRRYIIEAIMPYAVLKAYVLFIGTDLVLTSTDHPGIVFRCTMLTGAWEREARAWWQNYAGTLQENNVFGLPVAELCRHSARKQCFWFAGW